MRCRRSGSAATIRGYVYDDFVAYYLLTMVTPRIFQHAGLGQRDRSTGARR